MHIVYVERGFPTPTWGGGAGTYVHLTGRELVRRGHRVTAIAVGGSGPEGLENYDGIAVHRRHMVRRLHGYLSRVPGARAAALAVRYLEAGQVVRATLQSIKREARVDLVEYSEGGDYWHSWSRRIPYISHLHGSAYTFKRMSGEQITAGDRLQRRLELRFIRRADAVLSPSCAMLSEVQNELGSPLKNAHVIPYPLDQGLETQPDSGPTSPCCEVLFAARNDSVKGGDALLSASLVLCRDLPNVCVRFYGFKPSPVQQAAVEAAALTDRIQFYSFVPRPELLSRYRSADICVVPSQWDNSPNTVYEAMAAGKPVVASNVGGIPELVDDGLTGILIPPRDEAAIGSALRRLALDPNLRARMGAAGRDRIRRLADAGSNIEARMRIYESLVCDRPGAH